MPANIDPIFTKVGDIGATSAGAIGTSIVSDYDGTGANNVLVYTADATNGSYVNRIRLKARGTNAVSVARIYLNNGSTPGTAANNWFLGEISLPATTASVTAATPDVDYPINVAVPPGYRIYVGISAASALASGWAATPIAGKY